MMEVVLHLLLSVIFCCVCFFCKTCSSPRSSVVASPDCVFGGEKTLKKKAGSLPRILFVIIFSCIPQHLVVPRRVKMSTSNDR